MNITIFLRDTITRAVKDVYDLDVEEVFIERPDNKSLGDYATNIALRISQSVGHSPMETARNICYRIEEYDLHEEVDGVNIKIFDSVKAANPGFINVVFTKGWLIYVLKNVSDMHESYGSSEKKVEKVMVEYTDPNPFKIFHVGHLMTNTIGESLSRLWEFSGYETRRANYQGDVGMHVAKSIWGMQNKLGSENIEITTVAEKPLPERMIFLGESYSLGATKYKEDEEIARQIKEINSYVFLSAQMLLQESEGWNPIIDYKAQVTDFDAPTLEEIKKLYEFGRAWSLEHFEEIYQILGTKFDHYYFESQVGEIGYAAVISATNEGVFKKDQGAIIFEGEQYGLHTRVFINSFGLPTYEAKELGLARKKFDDFQYDKSIVVTANEITEYFKVLIKAVDLVYPDLSGKIMHVPHGMMKLSSGKMSSRTGQIISGSQLVEDVVESVRERTAASGAVLESDIDSTSRKVAVGAIKYSILKNGIGKDVVYDKEASLEMTGNTGAYIQYAFVRASSVLEKSKDTCVFDEAFIDQVDHLEDIEAELLRLLLAFPEVVERATHEFAPNYVCTYLFDLAQCFSRFYAENPILDVEDVLTRKFRLCLTNSVSVVLKSGLNLLGIETVSNM